MIAVLREAGFEEPLLREGLEVSRCESARRDPATGIWYWDPEAKGDGELSHGLFQMGVARPGWQGWFHYFGIDEVLARVPVVNARVARWARLERGRWGGIGGWERCAANAGVE